MNPSRNVSDGGKSGREVTERGEQLICAIHDYAWNTYGKIMNDIRDQCPYDLDLGHDIYVRRQLVTWFASKWINPDTGVTVVDEFVGAHVHDKSVASRILGLKGLIRDEFRIIHKENMFNVVRASRNGALYKLLMTGDSPFIFMSRSMDEIMDEFLQLNTPRPKVFIGQMFPWYPAGSYRTCGVITLPKRHRKRNDKYAFSSHMEDINHMNLIWCAQKAESVPVTSRLLLRNALKKFPTEWVYQMYLALGLPENGQTRGKKADAISSTLRGRSLLGILAGLSREERKCLMTVVDANGYLEYSKMQRLFGSDDTEVQWSRSRPRSAIGGLRRRGLLLVGLRRKQGRPHKVLAVASDVLSNIRNLRSS